jgi:cyclase
MVRQVADQVFLPLTVGGGIRGADDMRVILRAGADKISINSAAVKDPTILSDGARRFGSQCVVLAIDAKGKDDGSWEVYIYGGRQATGMDAVDWARRGVEQGAGEILLTSMDRDGTLAGYDLELTRTVAAAVDVPVIASGGAGNVEHFAEAVTTGGADAALAASLFHDNVLTIGEVKQHLISQGIPIRPVGINLDQEQIEELQS